MTTEVTLNPSVTNVTVSSTDALSVDLTTNTTTVELANGLILPQSLGTTDSPTFGSINVNGTVTADGATFDVGENKVLISGTGQGTGLRMTSSESASQACPDLILERSANGTSSGENIGAIHFDGKNAGASIETFAQIFGRASDYTAGDEDGIILLRPSVAGTLTNILEVDKNGINVNGTCTSDKLKVDTTTDIKALQIISSHNGSGASPDVSIERSEIHVGTTNGYHSVGNLNFVGKNATFDGANYSTGSSSIEYGRIGVVANTHLTGSETGRISFNVYDHASSGLISPLNVYHNKVSALKDLEVTGTIALKDASNNVTTISENASGNIALTLPSAGGTVALTSDINVMSTSINSTGQNIQTSTSNTRFIHTGGAVNFAVADETYDANAIERWIVVNAGSDEITFTRTNATFTKLEVDDVTSSATSCKLKKGGVCEIILTATNTFTIFGSGVE